MGLDLDAQFERLAQLAAGSLGLPAHMREYGEVPHLHGDAPSLAGIMRGVQGDVELPSASSKRPLSR